MFALILAFTAKIFLSSISFSRDFKLIYLRNNLIVRVWQSMLIQLQIQNRKSKKKFDFFNFCLWHCFIEQRVDKKIESIEYTQKKKKIRLRDCWNSA